MEEKAFSESERHLLGGAPTGDDSSEVEEKPEKDLSKIVAFSLLGIFLLSGTFYAGYSLGNQKDKVKPSVPPTPTPIRALIPTPTLTMPTPSPTSDSTADWKTYENKQYKYSIKIPSNWNYNELTGGRGLIIETKNVQEVALGIAGNLVKGARIGINSYKGPDCDVPIEIKEEPGIENLQEINFKGVEAIKYDWTWERVVPNPTLAFHKNGTCYELVANYSESDEDKELALRIFDLILSTFKFLD